MSEGSKQPQINFENGIIQIQGRSVALYTHEVYRPFLTKFTSYSIAPSALTQFNIQLEYINSDSSRALLNLFAIAEKIYRRGHPVKVNWYYPAEDNEMYQQGKILESLLEIPFEFISAPQNVCS